MTSRKMKALSDYMQARAAFEGVKWVLTESYLQQQFDAGIRVFFGVRITSAGELLADDQQPIFFETYRQATRN